MNQVLNDFVRGVGMNFELRRERPDGGENLAGLQFAADERLLGCKDQLIEDRFARAESEFEYCHIIYVTHVTANVKRGTAVGGKPDEASAKASISNTRNCRQLTSASCFIRSVV